MALRWPAEHELFCLAQRGHSAAPAECASGVADRHEDLAAGNGEWGAVARNQTATSDFGHSCAQVPDSLHIAAYLGVSVIGAFHRANAKPLQAATFAARGFWRSA